MKLLAEPFAGFQPERPWTDGPTRTLAESRLFRLEEVLRTSPYTARTAPFTRLRCPEWVNVLAFTAEGHLLLVEQFRHGNGRASLEIVGGVCDPGEAPEATARRELREETGHEGGSWHALGSCAPNPAIQDNRCHFFLATACRSVGALQLDPSEELRVWAAPLAEWEQMLREGTIDHTLVKSAFLHLFLWEGWPALRETLA